MLAENLHGVSRPHSKIHHWWKRFKRKNVVKSGMPFNWQIGVTGRPIYNIKNQFESDSCYGQSISQAMRILLGGDELSAKSAYSQIFSQGGGVDVGNCPTQTITMGLTTEANVPSTQNNGGDALESFMEDVSWKTPQIALDCLTRAGYTLQNVDIDVNSIADAIQQYKAVIFVIQGQNGQNPTWLTPTPTPPTPSINKNPIWEHFLCFDQNVYPTNTPQFRFYNSWGTEIGLAGFQNLSEAYIASGYVLDCFAVVKFTFQEDLFFGCWGDDVTRLQQVLQKLGFFKQTPTGFFGSVTLNAVEQFQIANNINPFIGYVGVLTRTCLNQMIGSGRI